MLKKAIIATVTAGMIAAGALASATAASAGGPGGGYGPGSGHGPGYGQGYSSGGSMQFSGPGWSFQFGSGPSYHQKKFCKPIVKKVKWWDRFGRPHWKQVVVGNTCNFRPHHPHNGGPNWNGNGPGWGGGW